MLSNAKERIDGLCSVIMPTYNNENYIRNAIKSVLTQTYSNLELIIIDDFSTDGTSNIIAELMNLDNRIQYFKLLKNNGCAYARNFGLSKSQGEYIAFLDSDDVWDDKKLEKQIAVLHESQNVLSVTAYTMVNSSSHIIKYREISQSVTYTDLLRENTIIFSTVVCRFNDIREMRFKKEWYHEDYVFLLDCLKIGLNLSGINEPLVLYRVHSKGRSFNKFKAAYNRWRIYREYLGMGIVMSIRYFIFYTLYGVIKYI